MYYQTTPTKSETLSIQQVETNYAHCINVGNWLMIICGLITALCLFVNFGFDHFFSLGVQIAGHIATIIFAALFKIGYVVRCIGAHGLGHQSF